MNRRSQEGFTYIGLLIVLAIIGVAAAGTLQMGAVLQRHAAEEELLAIGVEFRDALKNFSRAAPGAPHSLNDLLRDPRFANPHRYLRRIPADPVTGKLTWGVVLGPDGQSIIGIHSLSKAKPIKITRFPLIFRDFEAKSSYSEWVFLPSPD